MKRLFILIASLFLLTACSKKNESYVISDYFPFESNMNYIYSTGTSNKQSVFTTYLDENKIQRRISYGNSVTTEKLQNTGNELISSFVSSEKNFYENDIANASEFVDPVVILKEPLTIGNEWTWENGTKCKITSLNSEVEVPYGKFTNAMEVTLSFGEDFLQKDYYVPNVGLVKTLIEGAENTSSIQLENLKKNSSLDIDLKLYHYASGNIKSTAEMMSIKTNDNVIEKLLQKIKSNENTNLEQSAKINNIEIDRSNSLLRIDFADGFIDLSKMGAETESYVLQAICDTFGNFYGVSKVNISVDGKNYESGHILIEENDFFTVGAIGDDENR